MICLLTPPKMSTQMQLAPAQQNCAECDRIWENYIQLVTAHLRIVARLHKAALQKDLSSTEEIGLLEGDLAQRELKARRAIEEHEAGHEPD